MTISTLSRPDVFSSADRSAGFRAALAGVMVAELAETGWIRVTGEDRVRWLNGMVTNSIQALQPGEGCFNFLLNAQGRIQGTANAFAEAEAVLLETDRAQVAPMLAMLDRFIIMDDVELAERTDERTGLLVLGPKAVELLRAEGLLAGESAEAAMSFRDAAWQGATVRVQRMQGRAVPRFELWATAEAAKALREALVAAGAVAGDDTACEAVRLLEGTPKFGADIRERELPQETGQTEALHFSKGCYLGQEIVERIRSRGQVNRVFRTFVLEGELPPAGTVLSAGGKAAGELTSTGRLAWLPERPDGVALGLGYVRREAVETGLVIGYEGGTATPVSLPLRLPDPA